MSPSIFRSLTLCGTVSLTLASGHSADTPAVTNNTRWVAIGDSITENGAAQMWMDYFFKTRLPGLTVDILNAGIGGDTAQGALRRMDWDVLGRTPTFATVMFGMNDVGRHLYALPEEHPDTAAQKSRMLSVYAKSLRTLVEKLKARDVRVVLMSPTPFEHSPALIQPDTPGVDAVLGQCAKILNEIAAEAGVPMVDVHAALEEWNTLYRQEHPKDTLIGQDRIHPGALGQFAIAVTVLDGLNIPKATQHLTVDAKSLQSDSEAIGNLRGKDGAITFDATFPTLPFVPNIPEAPLDWVNRLKDGRGEDTLGVRNLAKGNYRLLANGVDCGIFSSDALAEGISLGELAMFPLTQASKRLLQLLATKAQETGKLRMVAWSEHFAFPEGRPEAVGVDQVEEHLRRLLKTGTQSSAETIQRRLDVYAAFKAREPEIQAKIEALEKEACALTKKSTVRFELRPENSSITTTPTIP